MLEVRDISVSYGQHRALEGVSLRVDKGEIVVILGANGAGKTSLLKAVCGISDGRVSGSVRMDGEELAGIRPHKIVEAGIALVPEGRGVFPDLTVRENLTLGAYTERARDEEAGNLERVFSLFDKLAERQRQVVRTMSGGEQQMVAVGRAMMSNPAILALDEPSLGLSPLLSKELFQSLSTVREAGLGILLVEQNAKQSLRIADRGYLLENGAITHEDRADALASDPVVQKAYLGGAVASARGPIRRHAAPSPASTVPQTIQHRPSGSSPSEIAAAALKGVGARGARERPVSTSPAAPLPPPTIPTPKAKPEAAQVSQKLTGSPGPAPAARVPEIGDLVARASSMASRRPAVPRPNGHAAAQPVPAQRRPAEPTGVRSDLSMPDLGASDDRLRTILNEIEAAARRAENHRPNRNNPGR
jgi:branched-chain amino acid transport system ATP-binding protein